METSQPMQWNHSETIALATVRCSQCHGSGLLKGIHRDGTAPCKCVLRRIFRMCLERYAFCGYKAYVCPTATYASPEERSTNGLYTRVYEDFRADFELIAKRVLTALEMRVLHMHLLEGWDWRHCCPRLRMDRGNFFHAVYRIEQKLGQAFRENRPYPIFPCHHYFNVSSSRRGRGGRTPVLPYYIAHQKFGVVGVARA